MNRTILSKDDRKNEFLKSSVVISIISAFRMALGIISQIVIAYYFGTSRELDIFFIVLAIPSLISGIVIALFSSSIIPELTPIKNISDKLEIAVCSIFLYSLVMSFIISMAGIYFSESLLLVTTNLSQKDITIANKFAGLIWIIVGLEIMINFFISIYHLEKRFIMTSIFLLFPAIGMIGGTVILAGKIGISALVIGWLCMNLLSCLLLIRVIIKPYKVSFKKIKISDPHALSFLKSLIPISISILPFTILPSIDAYWVSGLGEGFMSYIGYSTRIALALTTVLINGIYTVILPYLSDNVSANEKEKFLSNLGLAVKAVMIGLIPTVVFLLFYREPILRILLERGQFNNSSLNGVIAVLPFYLIGAIAMGPSTIISRGYFAKKLFKRLSVVSIILIIFYFVLAGTLAYWFSYVGIGMTYTTYWFCYFFMASVFLDKTIINRTVLIFAIKIIINSCICVGISYYVYYHTSQFTFASLFLSFILSIFFFYIMNRYVFKIREISKLSEIINFKKIMFNA